MVVDKEQSWSDEEIVRLIQLIDQQRPLEEIVTTLNRPVEQIKSKARELALVLPKEFETRLFFRNCK